MHIFDLLRAWLACCKSKATAQSREPLAVTILRFLSLNFGSAFLWFYFFCARYFHQDFFVRWDMFASAELISVNWERAETFFWAESMVDPSRPEQPDDFVFLQRTEIAYEWCFADPFYRWDWCFRGSQCIETNLSMNVELVLTRRLWIRLTAVLRNAAFWCQRKHSFDWMFAILV